MTRRIFRFLLRCHPSPFRQRYGPAMEEAFTADLEHARQRHGAAGFAAAWLHALADLAMSAGAARWTDLCSLALNSKPVYLSSHSTSMEPRDMLTDFFRDTRYSCRNLLKSPGFTAVTVMILALGIGANTTIFTLVNGLFFEMPPGITDSDRLVRVDWHADGSSRSWSYADYAYLREHNQTLARLAAYAPEDSMALIAAVGEARENVRLWFVTDNYFDVLGVRPTLGRNFFSEESRVPGEGAVAMVSHGFWQRAFGGSEDAVGSVVRLNGQPFTVVGVVPPGAGATSAVEVPPDFWVPTMMQRALMPGAGDDFLERDPNSRTTWLTVLARLAPDTTIGAVEANLNTQLAALVEAFPKWMDPHPKIELLEDHRYFPAVRQRLERFGLLLAVVVALVLAVAGSNVATLLLARSSTRGRDFGVRMALGASRGRIVRQLLVESLLLALAGGATGYALAFVTTDLAASVLPFNFAGSFTPDARVLAFTLIVAMAVAALFGIVPALRASRSAALSAVRSGRSSHGRSPLRSALVVVQVALSLVLVTGAAIFVRSLRAAEAVDLGFETSDRSMVSVNLYNLGYDEQRTEQFVTQALHRLDALPGMRASTSYKTPFRGRSNRGFEAQGVEIGEGERQPTASFNAVGPGYFTTMGIPLLRGRELTFKDHSEAPRVVVVNQTAAAEIWPGQNAIGKWIRFGDDPPSTVVGVVADARFHNLDGDVPPHVFVPELQFRSGLVTFLVSSTEMPSLATRQIRDVLHGLEPNIATSQVQTMKQAVDRVLGRYRVGATLVSLFGALALVLAAIGLYGVLAHLVTIERRGIGIRMALGATQEHVARRVMKRGLRLTVVGIALGMAVSLASARFIQSFLYGIEARDPLSFFVVPVILVGVAHLASLLPAWQAARVDPVHVLKDE